MAKLGPWRRIKTWASENPWELFTDTAEAVFELAFHIPLVGRLMKGTRAGLKRVLGAHLIKTRDEHYEQGARLLRKARRRIVVLSTLRAERGPIGPEGGALDGPMRDYFLELHRIVYKNRAGEPPREVIRYADLTEEYKCEEAVSLLYYGSGIEIRAAQLPTEFLLTDDKSILIGFPNKKGELSKGFLIKDDQAVCETMEEWVTAYAPGEAPVSLKTRQDIKKLKNSDRHGKDCMCRLADLCDGEVPDPATAVFDNVADWLPGLHDSDDKYHVLVDILVNDGTVRKNTDTPRSFLDCGCGSGFGAKILAKHFDYWGIDVSPRMIAQAPQAFPQTHFINDDLFSALLGVTEHSLPTQFTMIACQGNTFDHFLGRAQKTLALYLMDQRLEPNGLLMFTGANFDATQTAIERTLKGGKKIDYRAKWSGNFCRLNVPGNSLDPNTDRCELFLHAIGNNWLIQTMKMMKYERVVIDQNRWLPVGGTGTYELLLFRKPKES